MSKLKLTTLANQDDSASVPADTIVSGTAKAWVNFNGTGTVAIRRAFNVSSVTDNGTGDYTLNFTAAMADADYIFTTGNTVASGSVNGPYFFQGTHTKTTSAFQIVTYSYVSTAVDNSDAYVAIFS